MRKFTMLRPSLWSSPQFKKLESSDGKLLYLYFTSGPHQTSAGCFRLPDEYAAADLTWKVEHYQKLKLKFINSGTVLYDEDTQEMLINGWLEDNPPTSHKHF